MTQDRQVEEQGRRDEQMQCDDCRWRGSISRADLKGRSQGQTTATMRTAHNETRNESRPRDGRMREPMRRSGERSRKAKRKQKQRRESGTKE